MSAVLEVRQPRARYVEALQPPLVRQFGLLVTAQGGVERLRELILTLAMRGKLVSQDPSDEPARVFIERIGLHRSARSSRSERSEAVVPQSAEEEAPFSLPAGWQWARLGSIFTLQYGAALPDKARVAGSIPVYGSNGQVGTHCEALVPDPSIVIGRKGSVGAVNVTSGPFWPIDTAYFVSPPLGVHLDFAYWLFRSLRLGKHDKATAIPGISRSDVYGELIALPPTAEQIRIVARVDELMRLCDALEAKGRLEAEQHVRLLGTLLGTLTDSSTPEELAANWQRVADHFDLLLDRPEAVDALEQTILQLAVRGLLVPQDDGACAANASETEGGAPLFPCWIRSRLGDVVAMLNGYAFKSEWFLPSGTRLVRNVNVSHGHLDWQQTACVSPKVADEFAQFSLAEGDVVLTLDRPIISSGLKLAVVRARDLPCLLLQRVARLSPDLNVLSREFMLLWLRSDVFVKAIDPGRSNGVPHISTKQVAALTIDLPPLADQARIVARVTELRRLCADLRQCLTASQTTQSHLAEALVDEVA